MEVHSLRCYNCGGHHKASKRMEMRAILTANDPVDRGAESSQVGSTLQAGQEHKMRIKRSNVLVRGRLGM